MKKLVIGLLCMMFLFACSDKKEITLKHKEIKLEYGATLQIDKKDIFNTEDKDIINSIKIDMDKVKYIEDSQVPKVGTYTLNIKYKDGDKEQEQEITLIVSDQTKPEFINMPKQIEVNKGDSEFDFKGCFEVRELSKYEIKIDTSQIDFQTPGVYTLIVEATDTYDNRNKEEVKVVVKDQEVKPIEETPPSEIPTSQEPTYVDGILVVNKKHPLANSYAPGENTEAGDALRKMIGDMQTQGLDISNTYSGFRSYEYQAQLYQGYCDTYGQAQADTFSARAGYSEHQSGLAFDLLHTNGALVENRAEADWIMENAYKYGFIVRYQQGKESITGYQAEPWHVRYIGDKAEAIYRSGLTLEEYLGIQGGGY